MTEVFDIIVKSFIEPFLIPIFTGFLGLISGNVINFIKRFKIQKVLGFRQRDVILFIPTVKSSLYNNKVITENTKLSNALFLTDFYHVAKKYKIGKHITIRNFSSFRNDSISNKLIFSGGMYYNDMIYNLFINHICNIKFEISQKSYNRLNDYKKIFYTTTTDKNIRRLHIDNAVCKESEFNRETEDFLFFIRLCGDVNANPQQGVCFIAFYYTGYLENDYINILESNIKQIYSKTKKHKGSYFIGFKVGAAGYIDFNHTIDLTDKVFINRMKKTSDNSAERNKDV